MSADPRSVPAYASIAEIKSNIPAYASSLTVAESPQSPSYASLSVPANSPSYLNSSTSTVHTQTVPLYASMSLQTQPEYSPLQSTSPSPVELLQTEILSQTDSTPSAYQQTSEVIPSAYNLPTPESPVALYASGDYSSASLGNSPVPIYASFKRESEAPQAYSQPLSSYSSNSDYSSSPYGSSYQTLGTQTSYMSMMHSSPTRVATGSLRIPKSIDLPAKTNADGSIEGWLWSQKENGQWERKYFKFAASVLRGFSQFPQGDVAPDTTLSLRTGMIVTPSYPSYVGVNGRCFAIQREPKSTRIQMLDATSDADRSIWVNAFEKATRSDEVTAWVPWEMEQKAALIQREQELRLQQQKEEERMRYEQEKMVQKKLEEIKQQEMAKVADSSMANQLANVYENEKQMQRLEASAKRLRQETDQLNNYKQQVAELNDPSTKKESAVLDSSIYEREKKLELLEAEKKRKMEKENQELNSTTYAEELKRLKEEQEKILKQEEARIRAELTAQFEKEAEIRRAELEERLRNEKKEQKEKAKNEEVQQVTQWLQDNPSWAEYYQNLGVTTEELNDPACLKLIKKLIKDTARFVISSGVPDETFQPPGAPPTDSSSILASVEQECPSSQEMQPNFEDLVPNRAPPPPPSEEELELPIDSPPAIPNDPPPDIPQEFAPPMRDTLPVEGDAPVPPPPMPPPPMPPPEPQSAKLKITKTQGKIAAQPEERMMDQIASFKFKEKQRTEPAKTELTRKPSMLDEIHSFKFKPRKAVPTINQLPPQNQDSLTALLSNQLSIFRTKLREDQLDGTDDDDDDDYWD